MKQKTRTNQPVEPEIDTTALEKLSVDSTTGEVLVNGKPIVSLTYIDLEQLGSYTETLSKLKVGDLVIVDNTAGVIEDYLADNLVGYVNYRSAEDGSVYLTLGCGNVQTIEVGITYDEDSASVDEVVRNMNGDFRVGASGESSKIYLNGVEISTKPIYCHPIIFELDNTSYSIRLMFLLFNDTATAYTWETLKQYLNTFTGRVMLTGACNDKVHSQVTIASMLRIQGAGVYRVYGVSTAGDVVDGNNYAVDLGSMTPSYFLDEVNKIN